MQSVMLDTSPGPVAALVRRGGRPVVLLHGMGCCKEHFSGAFAAACGAGRGVLAADLPGTGGSPALPEGLAHGGEALARVLAGALASAGVRRPVLVLHSMASMLLPGLLRELDAAGVVLLEGNLVPEDTGWSTKIASLDDAAFARYFGLLRRTGKMMMGSWLKRSLGADELAALGACFEATDPRAFREIAALGREITLGGGILEALAGFAGPKRYLRGAESPPWGGGPDLERAGVEFMEIPGAGHFPHIDNPDETYGAVFGLEQREESRC